MGIQDAALIFDDTKNKTGDTVSFNVINLGLSQAGGSGGEEMAVIIQLTDLNPLDTRYVEISVIESAVEAIPGSGGVIGSTGSMHSMDMIVGDIYEIPIDNTLPFLSLDYTYTGGGFLIEVMTWLGKKGDGQTRFQL